MKIRFIKIAKQPTLEEIEALDYDVYWYCPICGVDASLSGKRGDVYKKMPSNFPKPDYGCLICGNPYPNWKMRVDFKKPIKNKPLRYDELLEAKRKLKIKLSKSQWDKISIKS